MSAVAFEHRLAYHAQREARVALAAMQVPFEIRDRRQVHRTARPGAAPTRSPAVTPRPGRKGWSEIRRGSPRAQNVGGAVPFSRVRTPRQLDVQRVEVAVEDALEELRSPRVG